MHTSGTIRTAAFYLLVLTEAFPPPEDRTNVSDVDTDMIRKSAKGKHHNINNPTVRSDRTP